MNEGEVEKKSGLIKLTVYINKDEDYEDEDRKNVDLAKLFIRDYEDHPYFIKLQVADTFTTRELAMKAVGEFNEVLQL